jgi:carbonic anhydrase/acetyltransferase-like protein (isoleucine patch superfamily)
MSRERAAGPWLFEARGVRPRVAADVWLAPTASLIGDVEVGSESSIWFGCVLRGDVHFVRIGERSNLQDGTIVHVTRERFPTRVGSDVTVGHGSIVHGCEVGDGAFIGMRATIMDGAVVEPGAMVAAGALVTPGRVVPAGELWGGTPARLLRPLSDEDREHFVDTSRHYVALAREYLARG